MLSHMNASATTAGGLSAIVVKGAATVNHPSLIPASQRSVRAPQSLLSGCATLPQRFLHKLWALVNKLAAHMVQTVSLRSF